MTDELYGELSIISTKGNEDFARQVDDWIRQWRSEEAVALAQKEKVGADATLFDTDIHVDSFVASADTIRFADGEGKCVLHESMRGHDVYILCDLFNYGVTYKMYGVEQRMSPDDHYQDLKRIIGAIGGETYLGRYADDIRGQTGQAQRQRIARLCHLAPGARTHGRY